jgi:hypothetical protein
MVFLVNNLMIHLSNRPMTPLVNHTALQSILTLLPHLIMVILPSPPMFLPLLELAMLHQLRLMVLPSTEPPPWGKILLPPHTPLLHLLTMLLLLPSVLLLLPSVLLLLLSVLLLLLSVLLLLPSVLLLLPTALLLLPTALLLLLTALHLLPMALHLLPTVLLLLPTVLLLLPTVLLLLLLALLCLLTEVHLLRMEHLPLPMVVLHLEPAIQEVLQPRMGSVSWRAICEAAQLVSVTWPVKCSPLGFLPAFPDNESLFLADKS